MNEDAAIGELAIAEAPADDAQAPLLMGQASL